MGDKHKISQKLSRNARVADVEETDGVGQTCPDLLEVGANDAEASLNGRVLRLGMLAKLRPITELMIASLAHIPVMHTNGTFVSI